MDDVVENVRKLEKMRDYLSEKFNQNRNYPTRASEIAAGFAAVATALHQIKSTPEYRAAEERVSHDGRGPGQRPSSGWQCS